MNAIQKDISHLTLQIIQNDNKERLTNGQKALLNVIKDCVEKKIPISFDLIVAIYYTNISTTQKTWSGGKYDIMQEYINKTTVFQYYCRPKIKTWFVQNIGILVIKNELIVIPTIDIE